MTVLTQASDAGIDSNQARQVACGNLYAGEALDSSVACYIKQSDGLVYMSDAVALAEAANFIGFTPKAYDSGEPVTLFGAGSRLRYSTGMTPGTLLYISAADAYTDIGRLDTLATVGDTLGTAVALNATDILITRTKPNYG